MLSYSKVSFVLLVLLVCAYAQEVNTKIDRQPLSPENFITKDEDIVYTPNGAVQGAVYDTARAFYAIPYAAPPVNDLRFQNPQSVTPWNDTLQATIYGPGCPQDCNLPPYTCTYAGTSEDCLTVNIFTPRGNLTNLPVLFFIHGGNFIQGGSGTVIYNADYISNTTNVVVAVIQYRLGALAYFINNGFAGNLGIKDQNFALQWVQSNIASFGGDPNQVTIFGQSAGGSSVAAQVVTPYSAGLFHGAIMESNPISLFWNPPDIMQSMSSTFAANLGCDQDDTDCLLAADVDDILVAQNDATSIYPQDILNIFMPWQPYVDGDWLPDTLLNVLYTGDYNKVPFIAGSVNDEGQMFIYEAFSTPLPYDEYLLLIGAIFTEAAPLVNAQFPVPTDEYDDTREHLSQIATQYIFACPIRHAIKTMSGFSSQPQTYLYHFNHYFTNFDPWGPDYSMCIDYVCHGSELPYVFNSAEIGSFYTDYIWSADEAVLASEMATTWGNFANSLDPNMPYSVSVQWPEYNSYYNQNIQFATPNNSIENYLDAECDFWDGLLNPQTGRPYNFGN